MTSFPNKIPHKSSINDLHIFGGYPLVVRYANMAIFHEAFLRLSDKYYLLVDFFVHGISLLFNWGHLAANDINYEQKLKQQNDILSLILFGLFGIQYSISKRKYVKRLHSIQRECRAQPQTNALTMPTVGRHSCIENSVRNYHH